MIKLPIWILVGLTVNVPSTVRSPVTVTSVNLAVLGVVAPIGVASTLAVLYEILTQAFAAPMPVAINVLLPYAPE